MATEKRLIDAEALKKAIRMWPRTKQPTLFYIGTIFRGIEEAPTVDAVEVVHGRWKAHKPDCRGYTSGFICSCCGDIVYTDYSMKGCIYNYCPNCGAKMDGDGNG